MYGEKLSIVPLPCQHFSTFLLLQIAFLSY